MNRKVREDISELAGLVRKFCEMKPDTSETAVVEALEGRLFCDERSSPEMKDTVVRCRNNQNTKFEVRLYVDMDEGEKRFALFRQIGHLFLHMGYMIDDELWGRADEHGKKWNLEEKIEADEFALDILMPAGEYRKVLKDNTQEGSVDLKSIAKFFGVPLDAVIRRGRRLGYLGW